MHKFVYPSSDAYLTNHPDYRTKNFGRDEILEISSEMFSIKTYMITSSVREAVTNFVGLSLLRFTGELTGSLTGSASDISGSIIGCGLVLPEEDDC
jgi:hypothetical protein